MALVRQKELRVKSNRRNSSPTSSPIHQFNIEHLKDDFVTLGEKDDVLDSGTDDLVEDVRSRNIQSTIVIVDEDETLFKITMITKIWGC